MCEISNGSKVGIFRIRPISDLGSRGTFNVSM